MMAAKKADDSYIPSSAKESGFVMNSEICMAHTAYVSGTVLTIGEMDCIQFKVFVYDALSTHFATRKMGSLLLPGAWEYLQSGLVLCDKAAKWWCVLELLHLDKNMPLFADEVKKPKRAKKQKEEAA